MITPNDLFGLDGKVAVVTGATGRLGPVMAEALAGAGARVWLVGRDQGRLDALAAKLGCEAARCDVTVDDDVVALGETLRRAGGRVDVLVHNAHVGRGGSLRSAKPADYLAAADLALAAFQRLLDATRDLLVAAAADSSPAVIAIASMYGLVSPKPHLYDTPEAGNPPYYGAVKAGLVQLARYAAVELGPAGVRVNCLTPGAFPGGGDPSLLARLGSQTPLGRVGDPAEIATSVLYLASPRSSFTTGANLVVDGGWTAW
ncbi:SDR family NAD(P)-dependent oxidoreductase [Paractinoplanes globisporus]|jgi:NAD(P)-dependent dehydrogenase (short-subunit alcohol dehydrogenase family)|uniref:SDR family NAD(P)-dependent oxidoreductase n=1 Tax=Paractinoplanes globisporus TaxID=113565 RepID=A0ABW6WR24_9ACTN|nr:SDR family oxidoreductase [Actinoplanes globisporus]